MKYRTFAKRNTRSRKLGPKLDKQILGAHWRWEYIGIYGIKQWNRIMKTLKENPHGRGRLVINGEAGHSEVLTFR